MTLKEASKQALTILKQVMEEKLDAINIEMSVVATSDKKYHLFSKEEIEEVIKEM